MPNGRHTPISPKGQTSEADRARNKAAVRRIFEAFNSGNTALVDEVTDANLVDHTPKPGTAGGREGIKQQIALFKEQFPDVRFEEQEILAEGDVVYLRWKMTGTHRGHYMGRPPTGKQIEFFGNEVIRFRDGKMIEHRDVFDFFSFLNRLGLLDQAMLQTLRERGITQ